MPRNTALDPRHTPTDRGASLAEYALLVALIALVAIAGLRAVGSNTEDTFGAAAAAVESDESAFSAGGGDTGGSGGSDNSGGSGGSDNTGGSGDTGGSGGSEPEPEVLGGGTDADDGGGTSPDESPAPTVPGAPEKLTSSFAAPSASRAGASHNWTATAGLSIAGVDGTRLAGSATVTVKVIQVGVDRHGTAVQVVSTETVHVHDGVGSISASARDDKANPNVHAIDTIVFEIVDVTPASNGSVAWDGAGAMVTIVAPPTS